jgi:hypothetical protein
MIPASLPLCLKGYRIKDFKRPRITSNRRQMRITVLLSSSLRSLYLTIFVAPITPFPNLMTLSLVNDSCLVVTKKIMSSRILLAQFSLPKPSKLSFTKTSSINLTLWTLSLAALSKTLAMTLLFCLKPFKLIATVCKQKSLIKVSQPLWQRLAQSKI